MTSWRNRIVGHGVEAPDQLLANPYNWRIHPKAQQDALEGVLEDVGWVQDVIVNQRTGHLVDGHARVAIAISAEAAEVPVVYVDIDEAEEKLILATLDPLAGMAVADDEALAELLGEAETNSEAVRALLAEVAPVEGDAGWAEALGGLPEGDGSGFQTMTFTLSDDQAETVKRVIAQAAGQVIGETGNPNRNGNALALVCEAFDG